KNPAFSLLSAQSAFYSVLLRQAARMGWGGVAQQIPGSRLTQTPKSPGKATARAFVNAIWLYLNRTRAKPLAAHSQPII
ncbi:MAG: hypothetical protein KJZ86_11755, partial [Caldilineaceae bacterium]|nr:hypothetical protein [Caldilineaceae bacterium]